MGVNFDGELWILMNFGKDVIVVIIDIGINII